MIEYSAVHNSVSYYYYVNIYLCCFLADFRGFYPKGRGEVVYCSSPVKVLSPITLTDRGRLEQIEIHAYVAGAVPRKVCNSFNAYVMVQWENHM